MPISAGNRLLDRYRIEALIGEGGMSMVYRATDLTEGREVAVKVLKPQTTSHRVEDLIRFRREAAMICRLEHANLVRLHAIGEIQGTPFLVMDYFSGIGLDVLLRQQPARPVQTIITWMRQLSEVLDYVHVQGVLHRDLKPGNILVLGETLKLLDFGLAQVMELSRLDDPEAISGTFSYMSPEQTGLIRKPVDERSDLYSLGILFYQLLTRELPFAADDLNSLLHQQIAMQPRPLRQVNPDVPVILEEMVLKLLQKDPEVRYQSARGLLADLDKFAQGMHVFVLGQEDRLKKINYRTRLIGREGELKKLKALYDQAELGHAGVCLIGGEAGRGKSRLAEELSRHVFARSGWWISGHCFDQASKNPYQPFVEALDEYVRLLDRQPPDLRETMIQNLKKHSGELGEAICRLNPALRTVLGVTQALVPLDPETENRRFLVLCSKVFRHLGTDEHPLVLMIDDWQWADEGSLSLLAEIVDDLGDENFFLLGAYRDNEVGPAHRLQKIMSSAQAKSRPVTCLALTNLEASAVNRLLSEMLQEDENNLLAVSEYVYRHTSGNVFFAIEVLRQLVREKLLEYRGIGWEVHWDQLRTVAISKTIVDIILNRIDLLDEAQMELLSTAAVIGRKFSFVLLFSLSALPEEKVISLVDNCIELQFLEREKERGMLLFVHDRIKEAFYQRLEPQKKKTLHLQIAQALEASSLHLQDEAGVRGRSHPTKVGREAESIGVRVRGTCGSPESSAGVGNLPLFDLAHHYLEAGKDLKALKYILPAAAKAHAEYANEEAVKYYQLALDALARQGQTGDQEWLQAKEGLIDVYNTLGRSDDIIALATEVMPYKQTPLEKAWLYRQMGSAYFKKGSLHACEEQIVRGLALLGEKMPLDPWPLTLALLSEFFWFAVRSPFRWWYLLKRTRPVRAEDAETALLYEKLSWSYILSDTVKFLFTSMRMLNLSEVRMGKSRETALALALHAGVYMAVGWCKRGLVYLQASLALRQSLRDERGISQSLQLISFCRCWQANYPKALTVAREGADHFRRMGDMWELSMTLNALGQGYYYLGDYQQALDVFSEYDVIVRKNKDHHSIAQGCNWLGMIYVEKGDYALAEKYAQESLALGEKHEIWFIVCVALLLLGCIKVEQQQWRDARACLERSKKLYEQYTFMRSYTVNMFVYLAETWLGEYAQAGEPCGLETAAKILAACRAALRHTRVWPSHYGLALRTAAKYAAWRGNRARAEKYFRASIRQTERLGRRYELAKSLDAYALFLRACGRTQEALLNRQRAYALFQEIGAQTHAARLADQLQAETATTENQQDRFREKVELTGIIRAGHYLSSILDLQVLLEKIMDVCLSVSGAERGFLFLYPEDAKGEKSLQMKVARNIEKADSRKGENAISRTVISRVEQSRAAVTIIDAGQDENIHLQESVVKYGMRSILGMPLIANERLLGLVYLDNHLVSGLFNEEIKDILNILINQAAISIENARLYLELREKTRMEEELRLGREIQRKLLPREIPSGLGLGLEGFMETAKEIGGDYYDFIPREEGKLLIVIGDVTGKGVGAGLVVAAAKAIIHGLSQQPDLGPRDILLGANRALSAYLEGEKLMTVLCLEWDQKRKRIRYCNAGHEPMILSRNPAAGTAPAELQKSGGIFLGFESKDVEKHFLEHELEVASGDKILLYSDGVADAVNLQDQRYSTELLLASAARHAAKPLSAFLAATKQDLYDFMAGQEPYDDITLVALEVT